MPETTRLVEVSLYRTASSYNTLIKNLGDPVATVKGKFVGEFSDVNPQFLFQGSVNNINYAYVDGMYYWVDDPIIERSGITRLVMHRDPLMTFHDQIMKCPIVAERSSNLFNAYIQDPMRAFKVYNENDVHVLGSFQPTMRSWMVSAG